MKKELEIKLLKDTIFALREELEKTQVEKKEEIQHAVADANSEIRQLRASIAEMRDQIELREAEHEQRFHTLRTEHEHGLKELHQTIAVLREKLEGLNESSKKARSTGQTATPAGTSR